MVHHDPEFFDQSPNLGRVPPNVTIATLMYSTFVYWVSCDLMLTVVRNTVSFVSFKKVTPKIYP